MLWDFPLPPLLQISLLIFRQSPPPLAPLKLSLSTTVTLTATAVAWRFSVSSRYEALALSGSASWCMASGRLVTWFRAGVDHARRGFSFGLFGIVFSLGDLSVTNKVTHAAS